MIFTIKIFIQMRKIIFLLSLLIISCGQPKEPELVLNKAIETLQNANTVTYDVSSISKKAFVEDTLHTNSTFKFKKIESEPHIGFHFTKKNDKGLNLYYKTLELFDIKKEEKKVINYSFKNNATIRVLHNNSRNQESLMGILNVLEELKKDNTITFLKKEKIDGDLIYSFSASPKSNRGNIVNYFWIDSETYNIIKLKTIKTVFKNNQTGFTFYVCDFKNIKINPEINDDEFSPTYDDSFEVVINYFDPNNPTILSVGNDAPEWLLKDMDGNEIKSNYKDKYTFIECWKSSCDYCVNSILPMKRLIDEFGEKINFISVNFDDTIEETKHAIEEHKIDYTVLMANNEFEKDYQIQAFPSYFIIDKTGNIIFSNFSDLNFDEKEISLTMKKLN